MPDFAERVVVDLDAHTFEVDGEKFPWYVSTDVPAVRRLRDDLYEIRVVLFAVQQFTWNDGGAYPTIDGREFPWYITSDGVKFTATRLGLASVELAFLAKHVEADDITDGRSVHDLAGLRVKAAA
jgi:hypothetical protein